MKTYIKPETEVVIAVMDAYLDIAVSGQGIGLQFGKKSNDDWEMEDDEESKGSGIW